MVSDALRIGMSGLIAAQKALEVTSNNVANAANPGYTRQTVDLSTAAMSPGAPGGVRLVGVARVRDVFADISWRTEAGAARAAQARNDLLERAETSLGPLGQNAAVMLDSFFSAWNQLSTAPSDPAAREGVLNAASAMAADFNRMASDLRRQATDVIEFAEDAIVEVNNTFSQIARLNTVISEAQQSGANHAGLLDERDKAFDKLSELVGATVRAGANGSPVLMVGAFPAVNGDYAATLEILGDGTAGNPLRIGVVGGNQLEVTSGRLGGMLEGVNTDIPDLETRLDAAANALRDTINTAHQAGFDLNGLPGVDLFSGTGAAGLAVNAAVGLAEVAASATGAAGDGNNALAVARLRTDNSPGSAVSQLRSYMVHLGSQVDATRRQAAVAETALAGTSAIRDDAMGINIDEEMVDLIRYQRAFQASAQAIRAADEVLDTLVNRMLR